MFSGRKAGESCLLTGCLMGSVHVAGCAQSSAPSGFGFLLSCLNTGSDELGDLIGRKAAGRSQKHMVRGYNKMHLLLHQTFNHVLNSEHLCSAGSSVVARALSVGRTRITILVIYFSTVFMEPGCFYKHVNVSVAMSISVPMWVRTSCSSKVDTACLIHQTVIITFRRRALRSLNCATFKCLEERGASLS